MQMPARGRGSLQFHFLLIIGIAALCFAFVIWFTFMSVSDRLIADIGVPLTRKQALYDKARTLAPLIREITLAKNLASSTEIVKWARNENNAALRNAALSVLDKYRGLSGDKNYFLAIASSGNYYFENGKGKFPIRAPRYRLSRTNPDDAWFFATLKSNKSFNLNVNQDSHLKTTKVWINVRIEDGNKTLGVIGTGLNLKEFINNVAEPAESGVLRLLVDRRGAIQVFPNSNYIDFASIAKPFSRRHSLHALFHHAVDSNKLLTAIHQVSRTSGVATRFVHFEGKRYLAGVTSLPEVGWYDITLLDLNSLLPVKGFWELGFIIGASVLGLLLILAWALQNRVISPINKLDSTMQQMSRGEIAAQPVLQGADELHRLGERFHSLSTMTSNIQATLKHEVEKRTKELEDIRTVLESALQHEREQRSKLTDRWTLIAHELRSPLAVIGNTAQMLRTITGESQPELQYRINKVINATRRISLTLDSLLTEEQLKQGSFEIIPGELNSFCTDFVASWEELYERRVGLIPAPAGIPMSANWQMLGIALSNLLDNAAKYSPRDGMITVRVSSDNEWASISVSDDGAGISEVDRRQIFEKFEQGGANPGFGLGLYIVSWIAQMHHGHAEVCPDASSTFCIWLPLSA